MMAIRVPNPAAPTMISTTSTRVQTNVARKTC